MDKATVEMINAINRDISEIKAVVGRHDVVLRKIVELINATAPAEKDVEEKPINAS